MSGVYSGVNDVDIYSVTGRLGVRIGVVQVENRVEAANRSLRAKTLETPGRIRLLIVDAILWGGQTICSPPKGGTNNLVLLDELNIRRGLQCSKVVTRKLPDVACDCQLVPSEWVVVEPTIEVTGELVYDRRVGILYRKCKG